MGRVREIEKKRISLHFSATIAFVMSNSTYRVTEVTSKVKVALRFAYWHVLH